MSFADIRQEIIDHPSNAWAKELGYLPLYTVSAQAKILIVGHAPGKKAQESHIPWHDTSGDTLRRWLSLDLATFYDAASVALVPMDFYYPGKGDSGDLPPRKDFAPLWHPRLLSLMPNVRLTILVGAYAQKYYLGNRAKKTLTETVSAYQDYLPEFLPVVHPSPLNFRWKSKNPWFETDVVPQLHSLSTKALN